MLVLRLFSQSTMAMSSLMPSASTESEWKGGTTGQCKIEAFQSQILVKHRERPAKSGAGPVGPNAKFFIPTPVALGDKTVQTTGENLQEAVFTNESPASSVENISFPSPLTSESTSTSSMPTMQRIPSMDDIVSKRSGAIANSRSSLPPHSRRTASWSGSFSDTFNPPKMTELKPLAEVLGMPPSLFMPGDELHEVEL
ncbi:unnamed protein product [Camellia sinensis]